MEQSLIWALKYVFGNGLWLELMEKAMLWGAFISSVSDGQSENELKEYSGLLVMLNRLRFGIIWIITKITKMWLLPVEVNEANIWRF